jgi:nucleoside-diphosphate-sugar epimerase
MEAFNGTMLTMDSALLLISSLLSALMLSSSSLVGAFSTKTPPNSKKADIAVVGCGVLGTSLCKQLLSHPDFASRCITAITKSTARHEDIRKQVLQSDDDSERFVLKTMNDILAKDDHNDASSSLLFQDVVFCAPPSGFDNYPRAVKETAERLWSADEGGSFVFTSSGGVYEGLDGETVDESSPTLDPETNPRTGRLIYAEQEVIALGGCALRLAGLYTKDRGAHNFWLEKCQETGVQGREDGIVNLLHYDDAASACIATLKAGPTVNSKQTFLISDGNPTTRKGICESALKCSAYSQHSLPRFLGPDDGLKGKIYDGSKSNEALKWQSTYASFDSFMASC